MCCGTSSVEAGGADGGVGDGALGFWAALRTVWPETTEARCWVYKVANCLNALPKSVQPTAKRMLAEIRDAEDREHALRAIGAFAGEFAVKWPKAVAKIVDDAVPLLAFYDFPAEHWKRAGSGSRRVISG